MRALPILIVLAAFPAVSFAHPGSHNLICKSQKDRKGNLEHQVILKLDRSNGLGWYPPKATLSIDGEKYQFEPTDETKSYGNTKRTLSSVVVTFDNMSDSKGVRGRFSIKSIQKSLKRSHPLTEADAQDPCADANGSATFRAILRGIIVVGENTVDLPATEMSCTMDWNSGMSC